MQNIGVKADVTKTVTLHDGAPLIVLDICGAARARELLTRGPVRSGPVRYNASPHPAHTYCHTHFTAKDTKTLQVNSLMQP
ncbi:hypothetical protein JYU34_017482 [Plutella xylostella]|uniref:Uncharacterized protein n=1 Tax=Plutella xylostella TaxID=51655 RepID=A0ABQ7Q198_PLUXY|nr:hypothetical protein JYU34_017482 [Plutella xylostella]